MKQGASTAVVTDAGREFCDQITNEVFAASDDAYHASPDKWTPIAEKYNLRWHLRSGSRMVGGLPQTYNGHSVVDGPHKYIIKIVHTIDVHYSEQISNYIEAIIWEQAVKHDLAHVFAPVIDHGAEYRWIVMEEVDVLGSDSWDEHGPIPYYDGQREYDAHREEFKQAFSAVPAAFGVSLQGQIGVDHSGAVVAIDYEHLLGRSWAGMYDRRNKKHITVADLHRRNRTDNTASPEHPSTTPSDSVMGRLDQWLSSLFS
jgi:hypothetical protein